jgi:protein-tyrosine phosphatase
MQSSTLVISYLMKKLHITFREAISNIRRARPSVLPNLGFERQLKKYEE